MDYTQELTDLLTTTYRGQKIIQQDTNKYRVGWITFPSLDKAKDYIDMFLFKDDNQNRNNPV